MVNKVLIEPKEKIERRKLFEDKGYKDRSEFKCNVCNHNVNECGIGNNYDFCKPQIIEHVIYNHPLHCYSCSKCEQLFVFKKDFKNHNCNG